MKFFIQRRRILGGAAVVVGGFVFGAMMGVSVAGETRSFTIDFRNGKVPAAQRTIRVTEGDRVELIWKADKTVGIHLHGYDIHLSLKPDESGTMSFEAHIAGRFPVGIHGSSGQGRTHGNVIYLEVHPR